MSWRNDIPVHPSADLFPLLDEAEMVALGQDIIKNGLTSPIAITLIKNMPQLVDGRNRLDAMERVGLRVTLERSNTGAWKLLAQEQLDDGRWCGKALVSNVGATVTVVTGDVTEYVVSANIHRRHLMAETKRELIAKLLKENPERSDRAIGKLVDADGKTVAAVRRREEDVRSIPHVDKAVDSKGRSQPKRKPRPTSKPKESTDKPEPSRATTMLSGVPAEPEQSSGQDHADLSLDDIVSIIGEQVAAGKISRSALGSAIRKLQQIKQTIPVKERSGGRGHREPRERAKAVLRENPSLTRREVEELADCAAKAATMARRELEEAGEIAPKAQAEAAV